MLLDTCFDDVTTQATLLVDAANAFNTLNCQLALVNISTLHPAFSCILIITYGNDAKLFLGGKAILSQEGTTHGDPVAMAMYALALVPIITQLKQVWYIDDAAADSLFADLLTG